MTLGRRIDEHVETTGRPDLVLVSDMVNLPALLGFTRRSLGGVPVVLYLHENQLLYPLGPNQQPDEALSLVNWVSLAAADEVWVNSQFHLNGLSAALPGLLGRAPDESHATLLPSVLQRCRVLPVGVDLGDIGTGPRRPDPSGPDGPLVLWNQRWDHDKNPTAVFRALVALAREGLPFRVAVVGENQRVDPREFEQARAALAGRIDTFGWLERSAYVDLLLRSDVVVSAARHEFFGIAVVEAIAAGAVPVLPDRLSYPEVVPARFHDAALYPDGELTTRLRAVISDLAAWRHRVRGLPDTMGRFAWPTVAARYDEGVERLLDRDPTRTPGDPAR